jgi:purine-nucleoside/S-methyl-5'-thioadenosine phosphorylase / adenosine deaminase
MTDKTSRSALHGPRPGGRPPDQGLGARGPEQISEVRLPGEVPRFEIPGWREQYGVVAGITGRGEYPGRGFDLGLWTEAPVGEVMTRWRAFRRAEPGFEATVLGNQVHRTDVAWHQGGKGWIQIDGVDGHATRTPGVLLTVTVADCIPVYIVDPVAKAIGLLHSGWRGTAGSILSEGVAVLVKAAGSDVANMVIHCGVGICGSCYEVGSEVMQGCGLQADGPGPWHADLRAIVADQARALGVEKISTSQLCSAHDRPIFFSHRASGGGDGRMVAYLGLK